MRFVQRRAAAAGALFALTASLAALASPAFAASVKLVSNVAYAGPAGDVLDEYLPAAKAAKPTPAVIFVHGGAWTGGDKSKWSSYASSFVSTTGWPAFNINYDMATTNLFATEPADLSSAIEWVKGHARTLNIDPGRIGLIGDSSGGHLAMLAGTSGSGPSTGAGRVRAVVSWSGLADLPLVTEDAGCYDTPCDYNSPTQWIGAVTQNFEGGTLASSIPDRWASTSPVTLVDPTDAQMLLFNSRSEMVNLDQPQEMQAQLAASGVPVQVVLYDGTAHGMGYATQAWPTTVAWFKSHL